MTKLLERAFLEASKLSKREQDALARRLLEELASEQRWDEQFAGSQDVIARMAAQAMAQHRRGRTRPLDPGHV
jgi:hypothetical protein